MALTTLERINAALDVVWARLQTAQAAYFATNGQYWQGLASSEAIPADNVALTPTLLGSHPTDQAHSWTDLISSYSFTLASTLPFVLRCDVYEGPLGWGYLLGATIILAGQPLGRTLNHGPETRCEHGWIPVVETP